ncbi:MAG: FAD-dependent thymidylate synthase [Bacilli bacterium]|nr:FAD-dependent thymidylate synthase [Bacilli bacterium]
MKVIKSSVQVLEQGPGLEGMFKHIERVGRISYKSEDRIGPDSWKKFVEGLRRRGHWAVFEHGTVYVRVDRIDNLPTIFLERSRWERDNDSGYLLTTNYRAICQAGLGEGNWLEEHWVEPEGRPERVSALFVCSRATSHQLVRHRKYSFLQASQRYCNYSKDKFGGELTYILPAWAYDVRDDWAASIDPLTGESYGWLRKQDGQELWNSLCCLDRTVSSRDDLWKRIEDEYMIETSENDGTKLKPEEARGILPNDIMTELVMTGWINDFYEVPAEGSPEKVGFFFLRCAPDAQPDIRILAEELKRKLDEYTK